MYAQNVKPEDGWPVIHTNAGSAAFTKLADSPGIHKSWFITGFLLTGGGNADGFSLIRRSSVHLAAATDSITFGDNAALEPAGGDSTIEFGFKTSDVSLASFISKKSGSPINGYDIEITSAGKLKITVGDGTATASIESRSAVNDDRWHHVVLNYAHQDASGLNLYIDGRQEADAVSTASIGDCTGGTVDLVLLGSDGKDIYLSTIGIYKGGILSDATIAARAGIGGIGEHGACGSKFTGSETNLSFAANLDEGTGSTCYDLVGSVNGTLAIGTWNDGDGLPIDPHTLKKTIKFNTGILNTNGVVGNTPVVFPHPIKIGRNNPIRIDETDGAWGLLLFGFEDIA